MEVLAMLSNAFWLNVADNSAFVQTFSVFVI